MYAERVDQAVTKLKRLSPERVAEVEDFIDFLSQRPEPKPAAPKDERALLDFPVDHVDQWPADLSLRREDLYGSDGR